MKKHGQAAALRHRVPGLFVAALALAALPALAGLTPWPLLLLAGAYAAAVAVLSLAVVAAAGTAGTAGSAGSAGRSRGLLWRLPAVIAAQQLAYGIGTLFGLWDAWRHGRGRERFTRLTR